MGRSPYKLAGVYAMTKAVLINMVKSLAMELMPDNIRINAIGPGLIETRMSIPLRKIQ